MADRANGSDRGKDTNRLTLLLVGDVMIGRGIDQILPHPGNPSLREAQTDNAMYYVEAAERAAGSIPRPVDFAHVWCDALPLLHRPDVDVRIANLETALTASDDRVAKAVNYRCHPQNAACLTAARFDCCVLANNHMLDWGRQGLLETLQTLEELGIASAGAGREIRAAQAPALVPVPGKGQVIVFAFGLPTSGIPPDWAAGPNEPGLNYLDDLSDQAVARISDLALAVKQPGDLLVASIHWGPNYGHRVRTDQRAFAHALIESAGFDVVHGHSSHHAMAIEVHRDRPILYGCGDFINDYEGIEGRPGFRTDVAAAFVATFEAATGILVALEIVPFRIRAFRLTAGDEAAVGWLWDTLERESMRYGTRIAYGMGGTLAAGWR